MAYCMKCSNQIQDDLATCPICGQSMRENAAQQGQPMYQQQPHQQENQYNTEYQQTQQDNQYNQEYQQSQQSNQHNYQQQGNQYNQNYQQQNSQNDFNKAFENLNNTDDTTYQYDPVDIEQNKMIALFSYIGILFLIPLLAAPNSRFAKYHANQGLVLFILEVAFGIVQGILASILYSISWHLGFIVTIVRTFSLAFIILAVLGIINATSGRAKELPIIGKIKIIK